MRYTSIISCLFGSLISINASSATAAASSSVTLYGLLDMGFFSERDDAKGNMVGVRSGNQSGSRWGIEGTEQLGNGWKANFKLESGLDMSTGKLGQSDRLFGRWAYLGLASPYGEVRIGRQWALGREWGGAASPFGIGWSGSGMGAAFGYNDGDFGPSGIADNMVMYRSPTIQGIQAAVGYSFQMDGAQVAGSDNNARVLTAGLRYRNGPLRLSATYDHAYADQNRKVAGKIASNSTNWQFGGSYRFKPVQVYAGFGRINTPTRGPARLMKKDMAWTLGVNVPAGTGSVLASWQQTTNTGIKSGALGYQYPLSKRTNLYSFINRTTTRIQKTDNDNKRVQFSVGVRHSF